MYPYQVWTLSVPKHARPRAVALLRKAGWRIEPATRKQLIDEAFVINWFQILAAADAAERKEIMETINEAIV